MGNGVAITRIVSHKKVVLLLRTGDAQRRIAVAQAEK